jgi:hypothetical protein
MNMPTKSMAIVVMVLPFFFSCVSADKKDRKKNPPENYTQIGVASWYGPGFHGKQTASGEIYDMYACTAAHSSLPSGVMVRVINLENRRGTIVKINDRGPYVGGRGIDLSRAAAESIGLIRDGTARVKIEVISSSVSDYFRLSSIFLTILSAILGTGGMSLFILLITHSESLNADVIKAIGSIYRRSHDNSLLPGVAICFSAGIIVAFLYVVFISPSFSCSITSSAAVGAVTGLFYGIVVFLSLVFLVGQRHPLKQFRETSFEVAVVYLLGCFIYGVIVGVTVGIAEVKFF